MSMPAAVSFKKVTAANHFQDLSFEVDAGSSLVLVTSGEDESSAIMRLIAGMSTPASGTVLVDGQSPTELQEAQLYQLRQRIGIVTSGGGMISNLKLWENITLPLFYKTGHITEDVEETGGNWLRKLGYSGNLMAMPAHLTQIEKRLAAFVRAMLSQPQIMFYCNCFEDMSQGTRKCFAAATAEFHAESTDRASIYCTSSAETARDLPAGAILSIHQPS